MSGRRRGIAPLPGADCVRFCGWPRLRGTLRLDSASDLPFCPPLNPCAPQARVQEEWRRQGQLGFAGGRRDVRSAALLLAAFCSCTWDLAPVWAPCLPSRCCGSGSPATAVSPTSCSFDDVFMCIACHLGRQHGQHLRKCMQQGALTCPAACCIIAAPRLPALGSHSGAIPHHSRLGCHFTCALGLALFPAPQCGGGGG